MLTLASILSMARAALNDAAVVGDDELKALANLGYIDVAVKGVCRATRIVKSNIPAGVSLVPVDCIRVNWVTCDTPAGEKDLLPVTPEAFNSYPYAGTHPQVWFPWGGFIVIGPVPDVAAYSLNVYAACYPAAAMSADTDTPSDLPAEFHECVEMFVEAFGCLKLRRWGDFAAAYNRYVGEVQARKFEYVLSHPDPRQAGAVPDIVEVSYA